MNRVLVVAIAVSLSLASPGVVARSHDTGTASTGTSAHAAGDAGAFTVGEVRKIDRDAQKVTLRHGPIVNLEMPEMTMVFRATDPAMLEGLKVGDRVRFKADKVGGQFTVTQMVVVKS